MLKNKKLMMLPVQTVSKIQLGENLMISIPGVFRGTYFEIFVLSDEDIKPFDISYSIAHFTIGRLNESFRKENGSYYRVIASSDKRLFPDAWLTDSFVETYLDFLHAAKPLTEIALQWEMNQCDGCQKGLPMVGGNHQDHQTFGIGCTANRYDRPETNADGSVIVLPTKTYSDLLKEETYCRSEVMKLIGDSMMTGYSAGQGHTDISFMPAICKKFITENLRQLSINLSK